MDAAVGSLDDQQVQQQAFAVFINLRVLVVKPWGETGSGTFKDDRFLKHTGSVPVPDRKWLPMKMACSRRWR